MNKLILDKDDILILNYEGNLNAKTGIISIYI